MTDLFDLIFGRRNHTPLADAICFRAKAAQNSTLYDDLTKVIETLLAHLKQLEAIDKTLPVGNSEPKAEWREISKSSSIMKGKIFPENIPRE